MYILGLFLILIFTLQPSQPIPVDDSELQELRAKIRVLEAKRADDARHVRELESRLSDAESFVALRPKLQAKLQSQQTELIAERRMKTDAEQLAELMETRVLDTQEQLEMAMLDKEVAEERAEIAEAELEEVKEKLAIAEVELDVMKDEREGEEGKRHRLHRVQGLTEPQRRCRRSEGIFGIHSTRKAE